MKNSHEQIIITKRYHREMLKTILDFKIRFVESITKPVCEADIIMFKIIAAQQKTHRHRIRRLLHQERKYHAYNRNS